MLLDAVIYIFRIYLLCCDQSAVLEVDNRCEEIKGQNEKSVSSARLTNNLLELNYNILENVKDKLDPFIENLLKAPY